GPGCRRVACAGRGCPFTGRSRPGGGGAGKTGGGASDYLRSARRAGRGLQLASLASRLGGPPAPASAVLIDWQREKNRIPGKTVELCRARREVEGEKES